ncbi:MAG: hypothetical protein KGJ84_03460 [Elusimicrobia bacterium]|nr:hypothetical protein [Elusimicrobiota bacterium]
MIERLLGKKRAAPEKATAAPEAALAEPAYYEVWGSLESANRALWVAVWLSTTVALLALIMVRVQMSRPPVVIRIDGAGQTQALPDSGRQPPVSEAEVKNFLSLFERFFTELNIYTYDANFRLAFSMMTEDFQGKANDMLKRGGTVENLKAAQGKTTLTLTEIKIVRDTPQVLECRVKGYRSIGSYKPDQPATEVVFEDDIILRKTPRSERAPYGLLVEDFNESVFKR